MPFDKRTDEVRGANEEPQGVEASADESMREKPGYDWGTCCHEAAHAVLKYHAPELWVTSVQVDTRTVCESHYSEDPAGRPLATAVLVAGFLVGRYAEVFSLTGELPEPDPFEDFKAPFDHLRRLIEAQKTPAFPEGYVPGTDIDDRANSCKWLNKLDEPVRAHAYALACVYAANCVVERWDEIRAVAEALRERGRLQGYEVGKIARGVRYPR